MWLIFCALLINSRKQQLYLLYKILFDDYIKCDQYFASVVEQEYTTDVKSVGRNTILVQISSFAPIWVYSTMDSTWDF